MREDLIAYALGELDDDDHARVEAALAADPELREELEQVRECLGCDDSQPKNPIPRGLAARTTAGICSGEITEPEEPQPQRSAVASFAANSGFISPMDMTVAIGILITLGSLLTPALYSSRNEAQLLACSNNLKNLGQTLTLYAKDFDGYYPVVRPDEHAGIFASRLREREYVAPEELDRMFVCPSSPLAEQMARDNTEYHVPTLAELSLAKGPWLTQLQRNSSGSYGYQVGYVKGNHYLPASRHGHSMVPVLADAPSIESNYYATDNHGGKVVNTLFQDGSVRALSSAMVPGVNDHLFVNRDGQPQLSTSWRDAVVLPSGAMPGLNFPAQQMPDPVYRIFFRVQVFLPSTSP